METYLWTCALIEDSAQPAHSRSLIRIFTGRIWIPKDAVSSCGQILIRLRGYAGWFESLFSAHVRWSVYSCCGSYTFDLQHCRLKRDTINVWVFFFFFFFFFFPQSSQRQRLDIAFKGDNFNAIPCIIFPFRWFLYKFWTKRFPLPILLDNMLKHGRGKGRCCLNSE